MKTALVTGASTGIGRATAIEMASSGYFVILVARNKEKLEQTKMLIEEKRGKAIVIPTDLSKIDSINSLITTVKEQVTELSAIINIAGIWHGTDEVFAGKDFDTFNQQTILDTYTVGFTAPTIIVHGLLPLMPKHGKIVNLSGTFENGGKGWLPYYSSKRAIEDLTVGLSQELADKEIQANCVSPSDTATEQYGKYFPQYMEDAIAPEEIAKKIVKLCDPSSTITGKVFVMKKDTKPLEAFHY